MRLAHFCPVGSIVFGTLMKVVFTRIFPFTLLVFGMVMSGYGQPKALVLRKPPIICYASGKDMHTYVAPPTGFRQGRANARTTANSTFQVTYIGFPANARQAFQYAVDIWQSVLISSVPIRITATWEDLTNKGGDPGGDNTILGSAGPSTYLANFLGAPKFRTYYPIAMAEKLARRELNGPGEADIEASFNSVYTKWYFGTDGKTPAGKTDLATVVLHEIGHGLGFSASVNVTGTQGSWGGGGDFAVPNIFDLFVENRAGKLMVDTASFKNPSPELKTLLTSGSVFLGSPRATQANSNKKPKLYAPSTYNKGSSISHLDEKTYPAGDTNSLMTPQVGDAEAVLSPGPILLNSFADMGWRATYIQHTPLTDTENTTTFLLFRATITSDDGLVVDSPELHYSVGNAQQETVVKMTRVASTDEYTATVPSPGTGQLIRYYLTASDNSTRTFTAPGSAPAFEFSFAIGPDTTRPVISHVPINFVLLPVDSISIAALVTDNLGVDTVYVEYVLNDLPQPTFALRASDFNEGLTPTANGGLQYTTGRLYSAHFPVASSAWKAGDRIQYRLVAKDQSARQNQAFSPASGYHTFRVSTIAQPRLSYFNSFDTPTEDFAGNNFSISTPAGFNNGAVHSDHPYANGSGPNDESNYTDELLVPIVVRNFNATVSFDEIVLVEPGEDNSVFGDQNFFDYVVVEGSKDRGISWKPLEDGYDSRYNSQWLSVYQSGETGENSTAPGRPDLFKTHTMSLIGAFQPQDTVLIRFRLFADQGAHGWGWAIDNLNIQADVTGTEPLPANTFTVFPNPTNGLLTVEARLASAVPQVNVSVLNTLGAQVLNRHFANATAHFIGQLDLGALSPGMYLVNVKADEQNITRKIVVVR